MFMGFYFTSKHFQFFLPLLRHSMRDSRNFVRWSGFFKTPCCVVVVWILLSSQAPLLIVFAGPKTKKHGIPTLFPGSIGNLVGGFLATPSQEKSSKIMGPHSPSKSHKKNYLQTKDINFTIRCASKPVPNRSRFCLGITPYLAPFGKHWLEMMLIQTRWWPFSTQVMSPFWSQGCQKSWQWFMPNL